MMAQLLCFTDKPDKYLVALKYLQEYEEIFQKLKSPDAETVKEIIAWLKQRADEESTQIQ